MEMRKFNRFSNYRAYNHMAVNAEFDPFAKVISTHHAKSFLGSFRESQVQDRPPGSLIVSGCRALKHNHGFIRHARRNPRKTDEGKQKRSALEWLHLLDPQAAPNGTQHYCRPERRLRLLARSWVRDYAACRPLFGRGEVSELGPLPGTKRKSHFETVRSVFDPDTGSDCGRA